MNDTRTGRDTIRPQHGLALAATRETDHEVGIEQIDLRLLQRTAEVTGDEASGVDENAGDALGTRARHHAARGDDGAGEVGRGRCRADECHRDQVSVSRVLERARDTAETDGRGRAQYGLTNDRRSEEHTSELQSQSNLVCRLLLEKKKKKDNINILIR